MDRVKQLKEAFIRDVEEASEKHPDIKMLYDDYKKISNQSHFSEQFLDGYLSCISDLMLIKKHYL